MIDRAHGDRAGGRLHLQALERINHGFCLGRASLVEHRLDDVGNRVAEQRGQAREIVVLRLIGFDEGQMLGRVDLIPGIARHDPAFRRLRTHRCEILRLAGQETQHRALLEEAAELSFADQLGLIAGEGRVEDAVGVGAQDGLRGRAGVDLTERRILLDHHFGFGVQLGQQFLEVRRRGLAILVVRRHDGPSLGSGLLAGLHQHLGLHVGVGPHAEGVAVALRHGQGVGQRLGRDEEGFLLFGVVADREADVGEEGSEEEGDPLVGDQFVGDANGVGRGAAVVATDDLQGSSVQDAAGGVDFLYRELPALAVGVGEGRHARVGEEFADLDALLGLGRIDCCEGGACGQQGRSRHDKVSPQHIPVLLFSLLLRRGLSAGRRLLLCRRLADRRRVRGDAGRWSWPRCRRARPGAAHPAGVLRLP